MRDRSARPLAARRAENGLRRAIASPAAALAVVLATTSGATALLLGAAEGAWARRAGSRGGRAGGGCLLSIEAPRATITAGEPVTLFGSLECGGLAQTAAQAVTVYERARGSGAWSVAGTALTEADGGYQLTIAAAQQNGAFYAVADGARSARRRITVAPLVTLASPPAGARLIAGPADHLPSVAYDESADRVTFRGTMTPSNPGAVAVLQRERTGAAEEWVPIGRGRVRADGSYALAHNFRVPGEAEIRVLVRSRRAAGPRYAPAASSATTYLIAQAQNPLLTINVSADPVSYGQPITIGGVLAGASRQPLTLRTGTRGSEDFPARATTVTDAHGDYSFTASPRENLLYYVTSTTQGSAVLPVAVKFALSAAPSATSVALGQPLTVSGSVSPALAWHPVYLERQNRYGTAFHEVATGSVGAGGSYTITSAFYGLGRARLRVKVPADALNSSAASAPFEVAITPAPAALLGAAPGEAPPP